LISVHDAGSAGLSGNLTRFRQELYQCLPRRGDALFELVDAVLCADGPVRSLPELSLVGEHRRGHGGLYAGLAHGRLDTARLRRALVAGRLPRAADGRLVLAVDITCWLRPEAHTSPQRILCHTYGRGKDTHIMVPGWPYWRAGHLAQLAKHSPSPPTSTPTSAPSPPPTSSSSPSPVRSPPGPRYPSPARSSGAAPSRRQAVGQIENDVRFADRIRRRTCRGT
jgi:hypothetical protein